MNIKNKGGKTMKLKRTVFLLTVVVTMGLLLGASVAQAVIVKYDPDNSRKVIEIKSLEIDDKLYNVKFLEEKTAEEVYGEAPGVYPFPNRDSTRKAVQAVNTVLNAEDPIPFYVGSEGGGSDELNQTYVVGDSSNLIDDVRFLDGEIGDGLLVPKSGIWKDTELLEHPVYNIDKRTFADFREVEVRPPGNLDDTWYKGRIKRELDPGWLTKIDGTLVKVRPSLEYYFKVCDERSISDCDAVDYDVLLAIADFDGDEIFEADEVFNISLATCGPDETSFVAEVDITDDLDVDDDPATLEVFNQAANGLVRGENNNKLRSLGCGWTADNAATDLDPDITGRKCRFRANAKDENELPFTPQDLVNEGVIADVGDLDCTSTSVVADAGVDQDVETDALVTLDGSGSVPAGGTYAWAFTDTPEGSAATLSDPAIVNPTFTPDIDGTYTVELTYTFDTFSDTDTVLIVAADL
jgi:hypothetical protein